MIDYEKLGVFYLGRMFDRSTEKLSPAPYLYDAKDLTTHAMVIGMTGSGKTGLCVTLLEEAAIDGIPAICIDPKGDIGNLMLQFPNLAASDFRPWVDPAEANRQGMTPDEFAQKTADRWKQGLAEWDQEPSRMNKLLSTADLAIYTPGSSAGFPVSVLSSFDAPPPAIRDDGDAYRGRVNAAVGGLLALLGIEGDALDSREHILMATIVDRAWREGKGIDIPTLLRQIQQPPFEKVGFLDLESFFPSADRFALVTKLNNLFASPAFAGWLEGEPLDVGKLLYTPEGKPRIAIMSIAHLSDSERMFFVTILLNEVLSWIRTQPGTSSLRAILYMDEIFGYFPPTANPPSKTPMLTLLKQARAYGLGVVLATQNPVDLDYKGMSNTGTWFLGRLQTERDKQRVLDGLEGASTSAGFHFDRATIESTLSGLPPRSFLVNNIHEDAPVLLQTRWALSYLRGPLTRDQIQLLMKDRVSAPSATAPITAMASADAAKGERPMLPPGIEEFFAPVAGSSSDAQLVYRPGLVGMGQVHFVQSKNDVDVWEKVHVLGVYADDLPHPVWEGSRLGRQIEFDLDKSPAPGIRFAPLIADLAVAKNYSGWTSSLKQHLYRHMKLMVWKSGRTKMNSEPGETEGQFKVRLKTVLDEMRDRDIEKVRTKYAPKVARLQDRIRKAEQRIEKEKSQASQSMIQAAITFGTSILSAVLGRKVASVSNVGRASTTVRSAGQAMSQRGDVARAEEDLKALEGELAVLEEQVATDIDKIRANFSTDSFELEEIRIRPRKSDLTVTKVALVWTPWRVLPDGTAQADFTFQDSPDEGDDDESDEE